MADLRRTIEIIFAGVDNVSPALETIGGGISNVGQGIQQATQPFADLSSAILLTSTALTALGAAALTFAANEAIQLENAFIELNKVLDATEGTATDFADVFGDISNRFGVGQADVISLAADFRQAGFDIQESLGLVTDALTAAAISELDVDQAGAVVIRTLNGFQAPAEEAGRLIDILNASSNQFAVSFGELGEGISRISPITRQLGFDFEETAGLLVPIIEVFGSGSEAANGLRTSLLQLGGDSRPVIDALNSVGIDTEQFRTARDRLRELSAVFPTLNEEQQTYVTRAIAGIEQASRFSIVLSNQETVLAATQAAYQASGAAARELEVALASTEIAIQRFQNSFVNIAAAIGQQFLPELGRVTNAATTLNEAVLASLSGDNFTQVFNALRGVFSSLQTEIEGITRAFPQAIEQVDFSPILEGLSAISTSISGLFDGLDLTTPEGLAEAIQFIVDSLGSLSQVTAGIISEFQGVFGIAVQSVGAFNDLSVAEQQAAGEALGLSQILNQIGGLLDTVGTAVTGVSLALGVFLGGQGLVAVAPLATGASSALAALAGTSATVTGVLSILGTAFTTLVSSVAALALPVAGLAAIFAELSDQSISGFIDDVTDFSNSQRFAAEATEDFQGQLGELARQFRAGEISQQDYLRQSEQLRDQLILQRLATQENTEANRENAISLLSSQEAIDQVRAQAESAETSTTTFQESIQRLREQAEAFSASRLNENLAESREQIEQTSQASENLANSLASDSVPQVRALSEAFGSAGNDAEGLRNRVSTIDGLTASVFINADTATAEQNLQRFQSVLSSIDNTITSTGNTLGQLASVLGRGFDISGLGIQRDIQEAFRQEIRNRERALELQNRLLEVEIRLQEQRLRQAESGEASITIDTTGLSPILDLLLTTIIQEAQIRASTDGAAFLVGAVT